MCSTAGRLDHGQNKDGGDARGCSCTALISQEIAPGHVGIQYLLVFSTTVVHCDLSVPEQWKLLGKLGVS